MTRGFWVRVRKHVHATEPIFKFLRRVDTGSPTLGKLYSGWFELGEFLNSAASDFKQVAWERWNERWAYGHSDVSAAAYVVDPEFHGHDQGSNTEVTDGFTRTLVKIGILIEVRRMADESTCSQSFGRSVLRLLPRTRATGRSTRTTPATTQLITALQ